MVPRTHRWVTSAFFCEPAFLTTSVQILSLYLNVLLSNLTAKESILSRSVQSFLRKDAKSIGLLDGLVHTLCV